MKLWWSATALREFRCAADCLAASNSAAADSWKRDVAAMMEMLGRDYDPRVVREGRPRGWPAFASS